MDSKQPEEKSHKIMASATNDGPSKASNEPAHDSFHGASLPILLKSQSVASSANTGQDSNEEKQNTSASTAPGTESNTFDLHDVLKDDRKLATALKQLCMQKLGSAENVKNVDWEKFMVDKTNAVQGCMNFMDDNYPGCGYKSVIISIEAAKFTWPAHPVSSGTQQQHYRFPMTLTLEYKNRIVHKGCFFLETGGSPLFILEIPIEKAAKPETLMPNVVIHCIRHAEAEHNKPDLGHARWNIFDPALTTAGRVQAKKLAKAFPDMSKVTLVLCSPMCRTMQTAFYGFKSILQGDRPKMILWPELRERGGGPTSKGLSSRLLYELYKGHHVDFTLVTSDWCAAELTRPETIVRAHIVKKDLVELANAIAGQHGGMWKGIQVGRMDRPLEEEIHIVLISHGGILRDMIATPTVNRKSNAAPATESKQDTGAASALPSESTAASPGESKKSSDASDAPPTDPAKLPATDSSLGSSKPGSIFTDPYKYFTNAEFRDYRLSIVQGNLVETSTSFKRHSTAKGPSAN
ncbi:phosphoglycerate mutase family protein [Phlyctema vagabunda]|uniref:Phosphoglycerate mutase family protein n=1 Tax=Phlyctema vagabunda TaxID=108571 RepID=A0ABR4P3B9_9HELO